MTPYQELYEKFHEDASFLWLLRSIAINQPHYRLADVAELENRLETNLNGLVTLPEVSWPICVNALSLEEPGEAFTATAVAFRSLERDKIQAVMEEGSTNDATAKAVASALAWLPGSMVYDWLKNFLTSKDLNHKYIAIIACSLRRDDPAQYLTQIVQREDCQLHAPLYARCLRLIGEMKRYDLMAELTKAFSHSDSAVAFWSLWSAILLGDTQAIQHMDRYVLEPNSFQLKAIHLALRVLSIEQGKTCISELSQSKTQQRQVIIATAVLGDPQAIPWVIAQMKAPALARLAGETFTQITGIDLEQQQLNIIIPDSEALFNEADQEQGLLVDADEHLPWPDVDKITALWQQYGQRFIPGQRYFLGQSITQQYMHEILLTGTQRQRHAAALELTLIDKEALLHNTQARVA